MNKFKIFKNYNSLKKNSKGLDFNTIFSVQKENAPSDLATRGS